MHGSFSATDQKYHKKIRYVFNMPNNSQVIKYKYRIKCNFLNRRITAEYLYLSILG